MVQTAIGNPKPVYIGESLTDCETLVSVKEIKWEPVPDISVEPVPATVQNTVYPVSWKHFHKYVKGSIAIRDFSEAYKAFFKNGTAKKKYIRPLWDNPAIPIFRITNMDAEGKTWMWDVWNGRATDVPMQITDGKEVVWIIPFVADTVVPSEGEVI